MQGKLGCLCCTLTIIVGIWSRFDVFVPAYLTICHGHTHTHIYFYTDIHIYTCKANCVALIAICTLVRGRLWTKDAVLFLWFWRESAGLASIDFQVDWASIQLALSETFVKALLGIHLCVSSWCAMVQHPLSIAPSLRAESAGLARWFAARKLRLQFVLCRVNVYARVCLFFSQALATRCLGRLWGGRNSLFQRLQMRSGSSRIRSGVACTTTIEAHVHGTGHC